MSELTQEEKRVRIAEACGWKHVGIRETGSYGAGSPYGFKPNAAVIEPRFTGLTAEVPDYFNDLNAMHEVERVLTDKQWDEYESWLRRVCEGCAYYEGAGKELLHATSAQRAEAFGKTLNLW